MATNRLIKLEVVDSTNNYLKEKYITLENNTFVQASYQTNGRGQFERSWESTNNNNILLSWLIKDVTYSGLSGIKKRVSDAIISLLKQYSIKASFRYPNDIYYNDKKLCGILIETKTKRDIYDYVIVGIGLNVNQDSFSEARATSMKQIKKCEFDVDLLINKLILLLLE